MLAEERLHSQKLMYLQNVRGGRVKLLSISTPESEVRSECGGRPCSCRLSS